MPWRDSNLFTHAREATQAAADLVGHGVLGPLPFDRFVATFAELPGSEDNPIRASAAHALRAIAALTTGDDTGFREHEEQWRDVIERKGLSWLGATHELIIGQVLTSVGNPEAGERWLHEARGTLAAFGDIWWVDAIDCVLCMALGAQGRTTEFLRLADALDASVPVPDRGALMVRSVVAARAHLVRGSPADAEAAARRALELGEGTDLVPYRAEALLALADAIEARGLDEDAADARRRAVALLRAKGNLAAAARLG